jgi:hypothetical protein
MMKKVAQQRSETPLSLKWSKPEASLLFSSIFERALSELARLQDFAKTHQNPICSTTVPCTTGPDGLDVICKNSAASLHCS